MGRRRSLLRGDPPFESGRPDLAPLGEGNCNTARETNNAASTFPGNRLRGDQR